MKHIALSIDMDGLQEYARIHGLKDVSSNPTLMYGRPLARFRAFCDSLKARATVFVIGRDAQDNANIIRTLDEDGYEIGNHSFSHHYALSQHSAHEIQSDIERAQKTLSDILGQAPVGFRAPGYHLSGTLLDALERLDFIYDSSAMPSAPYYALKAVAMGAYRLRGRISQSFLGSPKLTLAPRHAYHPGRGPYERGQRPLWELPITVGTAFGLPTTGGFLPLYPTLMCSALGRLTEGDTSVLNFHAIDFARPEELPQSVAQVQPEMRVSLEKRTDRARAFMLGLGKQVQFVTCKQLAQHLSETHRVSST